MNGPVGVVPLEVSGPDFLLSSIVVPQVTIATAQSARLATDGSAQFVQLRHSVRRH